MSTTPPASPQPAHAASPAAMPPHHRRAPVADELALQPAVAPCGLGRLARAAGAATASRGGCWRLWQHSAWPGGAVFAAKRRPGRRRRHGRLAGRRVARQRWPLSARRVYVCCHPCVGLCSCEGSSELSQCVPQFISLFIRCSPLERSSCTVVLDALNIKMTVAGVLSDRPIASGFRFDATTLHEASPDSRPAAAGPSVGPSRMAQGQQDHILFAIMSLLPLLGPDHIRVVSSEVCAGFPTTCRSRDMHQLVAGLNICHDYVIDLSCCSP